MESFELQPTQLMSVKEFLMTQNDAATRYNYAGSKFGRDDEFLGRGKFHTELNKMKTEKEWQGQFGSAKDGNVGLYTRKMLEECRRRVTKDES